MSSHAATAEALRRRRTRDAVIGLGFTQMIGWGTIFSPLALFAEVIGRDLGLSREGVFAGITIMLVVNAGLSPGIGRLIDRRGAREVMMLGSVLAAVAMLAMSVATGIATYALAWLLVGGAMTLMLTTASLPALVQVSGASARSAITGLTMITGLTSTVFLPVNAYLLANAGWRGAFLVYAGLHLLICLPIHARVLLGARPGQAEGPRAQKRANSAYSDEGALAPGSRLMACVLIALWSCMQGLITWGLYIQVIDVFKGHGLAQETAIAVWQLNGPSQVAVRAGEFLLGHNHSIAATALASALFGMASFAAFGAFGVVWWSAVAFTILIGLGHGLFAVARNTLPLVLFGARHYGTYMGWLNVPQNVAYALAPLLFASVIGRAGPDAALWVAAGAAVLALIAVVALVGFCRRAGVEAGVA